jgi:hypothetical protein
MRTQGQSGKEAKKIRDKCIAIAEKTKAERIKKLEALEGKEKIELEIHDNRRFLASVEFDLKNSALANNQSLLAKKNELTATIVRLEEELKHYVTK